MQLRTTAKSTALPIWTYFALFVAWPGASIATEVSIPGTSVSINAPDGFTVASRFSGLENVQDGSSITVSEMPAEGYDELRQKFSDLNAATEGFAQHGILVERTDTYLAGEQQVPVVIGSQPIPNGEVYKYMALFRGDVTVLVTFNIFDPQTMTEPVVKEIIKSIRLSTAATLEQKIEQLPFSFQNTAPFRVGDTVGGSGVWLSTFDGTDPTGLMPRLIIVMAYAPIPASSDIELVARQMLRGTRGFDNAEITTTEDRSFGGGRGHYLEALTEERKIVQFVRIPPDGVYVRLAAFGATADLEAVMPAVSEIAESVSIR